MDVESMTIPSRFGRYEIKAELGRGGMATVYHAYDPTVGRDVAVKVLPGQFLHDPAFRGRFEREAKIIASLEHSAIVPVYDFGEQDGQPFLVMRYMTGGSLSDRIKEGPLSVAEAARIFRRLAPALDQAHVRGIVHRDLKPGNILFDQYDDAYIADFGIAKLSEASMAFTGSAIIGTPAYMSPEQARGDAAIDGRSDIYALGAILFEMLTGRTPYEASTPMGLAMKHIIEPVPRILEVNPDLPPGCEAIVMRAMAKEPEHRFQLTEELADALEKVARGEPLPAAVPAVDDLATVQLSPSVPASASPAVAPQSASAPTDQVVQTIQNGLEQLAAHVPTVAQSIQSGLHRIAEQVPSAVQGIQSEIRGEAVPAVPVPIVEAKVEVPAAPALPEDVPVSSSRLVAIMSNPRQWVPLLVGAVLVTIGSCSLASALGLEPMRFIWPFFVIVPGAAMFTVGMTNRHVAGLVVPGTIVGGIGLILLFQSISGHWASWAYAWGLIPVWIGAGNMLRGHLLEQPEHVEEGRKLARVGLICFLIAGTFFELLVNLSGSPLGRFAWSALLVVSFIVWVSSRRRHAVVSQ